MKIREIDVSDSEQFLNLKKKLDSETSFMLYEPNERKTSIRDQQSEIKDYYKKGNVIIIAELDNKLVGFIEGWKEGYNKKKHCIQIALGVLQEFSNQGIGKLLLLEFDKWAIKNHIHRIELTVITTNENALALYKKNGFQIEGTKKHSLKVNSEFIDEYFMAKLL